MTAPHSGGAQQHPTLRNVPTAAHAAFLRLCQADFRYDIIFLSSSVNVR